MACVLVATVSAAEERDMIGLRQSDISNDALKRATPAGIYLFICRIFYTQNDRSRTNHLIIKF
jgi:hypothetical protein